MKYKSKREFVVTKKRYYITGAVGRVTGTSIRRQQRLGEPTMATKIIDSLGTRLIKTVAQS